ncbi:MAG: heat-inducible transcription repressor HrcA [Chloroflexi bacterium]|nr:heat-inducible transcription repressor HrcA [Chloroflexota bacterium]
MADNTPANQDELSLRQREVLRVLIQSYVDSAAPIGSHTIQRLGGLDVSSATIRNELSALEELGYLEQPHTSAGRVPTIKGYRCFVEQLMEQVELPVVEQRMISHQFHQLRPAWDQWMRLTAAVLAHKSEAAGLVTPPRAFNSRLKHVEAISIRDTVCLLIVVLQDGNVRQEMLVTDTAVDQDTLSRISNKLNSLLRNRSVREIQESTNPEVTGLQDLERDVLQHIVYMMQQADQRAMREVYRDGLDNVLRQPEFVDSDKFRQVVELLEHRTFLEEILPRILNASGVQIIIGGEGRYDAIDDVAFVLSPYGIKGQASGVLGVMGPTRMQYARAISAVQYIARLMDNLIAEMYATNQQ